MASLLTVAWAALGTAQAQAAEGDAQAPKRILFPVVGHVHYENDFGDPRGQGRHEGNDIIADWRAPVVAVEAGRVQIYTRSQSAGCMLYLYGRSGTTYLYIHLNNDLGPKNDNNGPCKPGIAYAPDLRDGQTVRAGQLIGYVGNSGDANAAPYHLHFELRPSGGKAVSPYRWLRRAEKLLFAIPEQAEGRSASGALSLTLIGTVVATAAAAAESEIPEATEQKEPEPNAATSGSKPEPVSGTGAPPPPPPPSGRLERGSGGILLTIRVRTVQLSTGGNVKVDRTVTLLVPRGTAVERTLAGKGGPKSLEGLSAGDKVGVESTPVELSLKTQRARAGVLTAARIFLRA